MLKERTSRALIFKLGEHVQGKLKIRRFQFFFLIFNESTHMNLGERLLVNVSGNIHNLGKDSDIGVQMNYPKNGDGSTISKVIITVKDVKEVV